MNITGVILAGGRGARMGGVDKGWIELGGEPLVTHVLRRLQPQVSEILISANRNVEKYARLGHRVIADDYTVTNEDFPGPLAGVLSALTHAQNTLVLVVPCDAPQLPPDLAQRLLAALENDKTRATYAHDGQRPQPTFALLNSNLRVELHDALQSGTRKLESWLNGIGALSVDFSDCPAAFTNINSPIDLASAMSPSA